MTIEEIIRNRHSASHRVLKAHAWRVEKPDSDPFVGIEYELWHYSTRMLHWRESQRNGVELLSLSLGHGSVSDQNGVNIAFRVLGLPLYYQRAGGAGIIEV